MAQKSFYVDGYGYFIYDSLTNHIITVSDASLSLFVDNENLCKSQKNEMCCIEWSSTFNELKCSIDDSLTTLVLQLTRNCNLRCKYCAYSGEFDNMLPHSREKMTLDIIYKSIDFFMEHSKNSLEIIIIFYGGEPLLEFESIKKAVKYAKKYNRNIRFGISSNGTLLSPVIAKWLRENPNVSITVTLNGDKHDVYRKTVEKEGSLQSILDNITYIREQYPSVWEEQVRLIANIYSIRELLELREFYKTTVNKQPVMITRINLEYSSEQLKEIFCANEALEKKCNYELQNEYLNSYDSFLRLVYNNGIDRIHNRGVCKEDTPGFISSCLPMSWRLFVRSDGSFNMCEKVSDAISLGNIYSGFNFDLIKTLYIQMEEFVNRNCKNCWAQRLCMFCYQDVINEKGQVIDSFPTEKCDTIKENITDYLKMYIRIANENPQSLN